MATDIRQMPTTRVMKRIEQFISIYGNNWAIGNQLVRILSNWGQKEEGTIVDYGCGESPFRAYFPYVSQYLRFDIIRRDENVIPVDGRNIPCADESVDCLLLFQVLGDIPDLVSFFLEVRRVLRPGGSVLIFETIAYPEHDMPHDFYRVMPAGLSWLAEQCNFKCVELFRLGGLFARFAQLWNTYILGQFRGVPIVGPLALGSVVLTNVIARLLDTWMPHPSLCPDYVAKLVKQG